MITLCHEYYDEMLQAERARVLAWIMHYGWQHSGRDAIQPSRPLCFFRRRPMHTPRPERETEVAAPPR